MDGGHRLIAGNHRLEAVRSLGWPQIRCRVLKVTNDDEAKLAEVMENLGRKELIALDRCHHLHDMKEVWERIYPQTAHGKASTKIRNPDLSSYGDEVFGFVRSVADDFGLGRSQISEAVRIWKALSENTRSRLNGTDLADNQVDLVGLSRLTEDRQKRVLDLIESAEHPHIKNVAAAANFLEHGHEAPPLETTFRSVEKAVLKLHPEAFDMPVDAHSDRFIAALKRKGRI